MWGDYTDTAVQQSKTTTGAKSFIGSWRHGLQGCGRPGSYCLVRGSVKATGLPVPRTDRISDTSAGSDYSGSRADACYSQGQSSQMGHTLEHPCLAGIGKGPDKAGSIKLP